MNNIKQIFIYLSLICLWTCHLFSSIEKIDHREAWLTREDIACIQEVFSLLHNRLEIARDIAKWKWNYRLPIDEKDKERELIKQLLLQALNDGIDIQFCTNIVMSQIIAAKTVQIQSFENWVKTEAYLAPFPSSDLAALEKDILEIDRKIIRHLMRLYSISERKDFFSHIAFAAIETFPEEQVSEDVRHEMIRPFLVQLNYKELENQF